MITVRKHELVSIPVIIKPRALLPINMNAAIEKSHATVLNKCFFDFMHCILYFSNPLILRALLQENGRCGRRYSTAFDRHNYVSVTINWLPLSSSPLLKPSKSKLLSLVTSSYRKTINAPFFLRILKKSNDIPLFDALPHATAVVFV